jgi:hypothetical protein
LRLLAAGFVAFSGSTVGGISFIPGIGRPEVIRATISAKGVGYGGFSSAGAEDLEARCALYASKSMGGIFFFLA